MKIHRFIGQIEDEAISRQIRDVLKLKIGERVIISDGKGQDELVEITNLSKEIKYKTIEKLKPVHPGRKVNLYLAILKKENFELAVQKAVECGVSTITPIITERTVKTGLNMERLEKIIREATEQCGLSDMPELFEIFDFREAINSHAEEKIIFHIDESTKTYTPNTKASSANIFIGPEGGFTEKEIELAKNSGFTVASLGPLTLRGETAAIIGTYCAVYGV